MTVRFEPPAYPGGRHCLVSGTVTFGAVFPPPREGDKWSWRLWVNGKSAPTEGSEKTELAAKGALYVAFSRFLADAELLQKP